MQLSNYLTKKKKKRLPFILHSTTSAPAWTETCYCSQSWNRK